MAKQLTVAEKLEASLMQSCGLTVLRGRLEANGTTTPDVSKARSLVRDALAPAPDRVVMGWIGTMSAQVLRRNSGDLDADVALRAYTARLRGYPADIVGLVLADWPTRSQWWPAWFELQELLEPLADARREWLEDLDRIERILTVSAVAPPPSAPEISDEERERRRAEAEVEHAEVSEGLRGLVVKLRQTPAQPEKETELRRRFREGGTK